ncbi:hypothetical protein Aperf_G00000129726 [Anoplocephala perfoliata]
MTSSQRVKWFPIRDNSSSLCIRFLLHSQLYQSSGQIISITGFEGTEKLKVEAVIKQIGATYTDYLDEMNTFLVCKKHYLAKLCEVLHQEEMEEEAAAVLQRQKEIEAGQDVEKEKEDKCVLPSLMEEEDERDKTGKLRSTLMHEEAEKVAAHRANLAAALAAQQQQQQQKHLYLVQTTPQGQLVAPSMNRQFPISAPPTAIVFPPVELSAAPTSSSMQSQQMPAETNPGNPLKHPLSPPSISPPPKGQAVDISNPKPVPPFLIASPMDFGTQRPSSVDQLLAQTSQPINPTTKPSNSQAIQPQLPLNHFRSHKLKPSPTPPIRTEAAIDPEVRTVFTDLTANQHEAIVELLKQIPINWGIAPYRLVDSPRLNGCWTTLKESIRMDTFYARARERRLLVKPVLFSELEFWFSPMAHHRGVYEELVHLCGGRIRERRPTQKMALLSIPKLVIICHEEDANVASYLMRTKTGNRAVHHEKFILSGVLRQELDFESYQIQLVSLQFAELQAAINANMNNNENINPNSVNKLPTPVRNMAPRTPAVELPVAPLQLPPPPPPPPPLYMRPPPPPPSQHSQHPSATPRSCVVLVSGAPENSQQSSLMYYISSESTARGIVPTVTTPQTSLTLRLPEGVSTVIVTGDEGLNAARVAAVDAHVVASATAALTTNSNPPLTEDSGVGQGRVNLTSPQNHSQQQQQQQPSSSGTVN